MVEKLMHMFKNARNHSNLPLAVMAPAFSILFRYVIKGINALLNKS